MCVTQSKEIPGEVSHFDARDTNCVRFHNALAPVKS